MHDRRRPPAAGSPSPGLEPFAMDGDEPLLSASATPPLFALDLSADPRGPLKGRGSTWSASGDNLLHAGGAASASGRPPAPGGEAAALAALCAPTTDFEAQLLDAVRAAKPAALAAAGDPSASALAASLAEALARRGYVCSLRVGAREDGPAPPPPPPPPAAGGRGAGAAAGSGRRCLESLRHTYILVTGSLDSAVVARVIVEPALREHFAIAQPTPGYAALLAGGLPPEFVGPPRRLAAVVEAVAGAAARAFAEQGLPLPPWRRAKSLLSKWGLGAPGSGGGGGGGAAADVGGAGERLGDEAVAAAAAAAAVAAAEHAAAAAAAAPPASLPPPRPASGRPARPPSAARSYGASFKRGEPDEDDGWGAAAGVGSGKRVALGGGLSAASPPPPAAEPRRAPPSSTAAAPSLLPDNGTYPTMAGMWAGGVSGVDGGPGGEGGTAPPSPPPPGAGTPSPTPTGSVCTCPPLTGGRGSSDNAAPANSDGPAPLEARRVSLLARGLSRGGGGAPAPGASSGDDGATSGGSTDLNAATNAPAFTRRSPSPAPAAGSPPAARHQSAAAIMGAAAAAAARKGGRSSPSSSSPRGTSPPIAIAGAAVEQQQPQPSTAADAAVAAALTAALGPGGAPRITTVRPRGVRAAPVVAHHPPPPRPE